MFKKVISSLALLSLALSGGLRAEPLYFQASKGGKELLILGSIHIGSPDMYPLPKAVTRFLNRSDGVILELDPAQSPSPHLLNKAMPPTRQTLSREQIEKLNRVGKELSLPTAMLLTLPAWQTAITLQMAYYSSLGLDEQWGIDKQIYQRALKLNRPVAGLESTDFQLSLFTRTEEIGATLLTDTLDNWDEHLNLASCTVSAWKAGDRAALAEMMEQSEISDAISEDFLYQRNRDWAAKLADGDLLKDGERFLVVVGAMHLAGEQNLIELLQKQGFDTRQLSRSQQAGCTMPASTK